MFQRTLIVGLCLTMTLPVLAEGIGYAVLDNATNDMYAIDMATGVATFAGSMGFSDPEGMAFADGELYAIGGVDQFWNFTTPPGSYIGEPSGRDGSDPGLAYYDGVMYNFNGDSPGWQWLYTIDIATGAATHLNYVDFDLDAGEARADNIAFRDGLAYCVDWSVTGNVHVFQPDFEDEWIYADEITVIGNVGQPVGFAAGSDVFNDTLYTMTSDGRMWTIDWIDGSATFLYQVADGAGNPLVGWDGGLAIVPEPASLVVLALCALVGIPRRSH